jgi:hypothetical protein
LDACGSVLVWSCSKEEDKQIDAKLQPIQKIAAVIPPTPSLIKTINRFNPNYTPAGSMKIDTLYKISGNVTRGKSDSLIKFELGFSDNAYIIFKHNFVKGNNYAISVPVNMEGYNDDCGLLGVDCKTYFPELEIFTLKSLNLSSATDLCSLKPLLLRTSNDNVVSWKIPQGQKNTPKNQSKTVNLSFTANECSNYIVFRASSQVSKPTYLYLKNMKITKTSVLQFEGEEEMCVGTTQTIGYSASGFIINIPVKWYVKGGSQIVGSNIGSSVTIKSLGNNGGKMGFFSCTDTIDGFEFEVRAPADFQILGKPVVRPLEQTVIYYLPEEIGLSNTSFEVSGATVLSKTATSVRVRINNIVNNSIPIVVITAKGMF